MKILNRIVMFSLLLVLVFQGAGLAGDEKEITKTYEGGKEVRIDFVLGGCEIKKSPDSKIHVRLVHSYAADRFEPRFEERSNRIILEEHFSDGPRGKGESHWTIEIPSKTEVDFESATGSVSIEGVELEIDASTGTGGITINNAGGEFDMNSGTGGIEMRGSSGEFKLNSGTGRIELSDCSGNFDVNSGTGRVEAERLTVEFDGEFNSGTGDVEITAPQGDDFSLHINSGTNDAVLDMDGQPLKGYFEFTAHARIGKIISPVKFDKEEEYWENDNKYLKKSFTRGKDMPRYYISTGTGDAQLKE